MGLSIHARLAAAGHEVSGYDPAVSVEVAIEFERVEVLVTVLPGRRELADAAVGPAGFLARLPPGALWLDLTSGDPLLTGELALAAAGLGLASVSAPMGGGPPDAAGGTLTFYVGGADAAVERALPILSLLGTTIERAGIHPADGQSMKLLANLLWFGQAVAVTEALLLGRQLGLELSKLSELLPRSAGGSNFMTGSMNRLLAGDYAETFGIDRVVEELDTLVAIAGSSPCELLTLVAKLHHETLERFGPVEGELLVAKLLEERAGSPLSAGS